MVGKDTHREESHLLAGAPRSSSEPVDNRFPAAMPWDELPVPDLPGHQAMAMDYHLDDATPIAPESNEGEEGTGADDALGLYLRQMGAIPLLNRQQELALAQRLDWPVLATAVLRFPTGVRLAASWIRLNVSWQGSWLLIPRSML